MDAVQRQSLATQGYWKPEVPTAKKGKAPESRGPPEISPQQGIDLIQRQIAKGEQILGRRRIVTDNYSSEVFGKNSPMSRASPSSGSTARFLGMLARPGGRIIEPNHFGRN